MRDHRIDQLAAVLVSYSVRVKPGQVVNLLGPPLAEPLLVALYREVLRAGGHPFVLMTPEACMEEMCRHANSDQLAYLHPLEVREVEACDVAFHILAPANTRHLANIDPVKQAIRSRARRPLMELFMRRAAEKSIRWVVTQFPCQASAQEADMSLEEYENFVYEACFLAEKDPVRAWQDLSFRQTRVATFLQDVSELRFFTPRGTDLRLGVKGRTWINCDGHENFPDGEVFTGPIEDATEGTVCFDFPAVHGSREVQEVRLVFRKGQVTEATAVKGEDFLLRMIGQDRGARILGEAAIGCNYGIKIHTGNTLFDEKIGGTFHVALGASYPESGGVNQSGLHWDMVGDLRQGGRIEADGIVISENGRFSNPDWPQPFSE